MRPGGLFKCSFFVSKKRPATCAAKRKNCGVFCSHFPHSFIACLTILYAGNSFYRAQLLLLLLLYSPSYFETPYFTGRNFSHFRLLCEGNPTRVPSRVPSEGTLQAGFWRYYRLRRFFLWCLFYEKRCIHAPLREGSLGVPLVRNRFSRCASVFLKPGNRIYASTLGESLSFPLAIEAEKNGVLPVALGQSGEGHKKAAIFKEMAAFRI